LIGGSVAAAGRTVLRAALARTTCRDDGDRETNDRAECESFPVHLFRCLTRHTGPWREQELRLRPLGGRAPSLKRASPVNSFEIASAVATTKADRPYRKDEGYHGDEGVKQP